jgi:hypothetical protein
MSGVRFACRRGTLALVARKAAGRFVAGRGKARVRAGFWTPTPLRWRRWRRRPVQRALRVAAARTVWSPQFHFLVSAHLKDGLVRTERLVAGPGTTTRESRQIMVSRGETIFRASRPGLLRAGAAAVRSTVREGRAGGAMVTVSATASAGPLRSTAAVVPRFAGRAGRRGGQLRATIVAAGGFARRGAPASEPRGAIHQPAPQIFRSGRPVPGNVTAPTTQANQPRRGYLSSSPELVWRRLQRLSDGAVDGARAMVAPPSFQRALARPPSSPESAPPAPPFSGPRATSPATQLDPALLDRLTDDVIRRVERRVRIERERRGL